MRTLTAALVLAVLVAGCGSSHSKSASSLAPIHGRYAPKIDPKNFVERVDNPLWPLEPGTDPQPGDRYRQEYYPPGEALDEAHVLGFRGPPKVPYRAFKRALVTSEISPLEPQTEEKYYVRGIGEILERVVNGHHEEFELVSVTH